MLQRFINIFKDEEDSDHGGNETPGKPKLTVSEVCRNPKLETWYSKEINQKRERRILKKIKS